MSWGKEITLYWHDYETWGEVPALDKPSQFAGIRTDLELNVIGSPLMIYAKPAQDLLPKPEACLITGISPQTAIAKGLIEREFVAAIHAELSRPGTCGVGFNSIRFDDEVTRYALYRNFYDPYEREWRNGNSRWDIIDMVRMTRTLRPEGINWPNYDDGTPAFKLEMLTAANDLAHEAAHDALSDVYATIAVARLIKTRQPKLYDYAFRLRDKRFAASLIDIANRKPLLHISSKFSGSQGNAALMLPLCYHPTNKNSVIAYNLSADPTDLLRLNADELRLRLYTRAAELPEGVERLAIKEIHLNKSPMLLPLSMLDDEIAERINLNRADCERHWRAFHQLTSTENDALLAKLNEIYAERVFDDALDVEQQLYSGFFSEEDKQQMRAVRSASVQMLSEKEFIFSDERLNKLLFRYRARNFPQSLNAEELSAWRSWCKMRLTDPAAGGSILLVDYFQSLAGLENVYAGDESKLELVTELKTYGHGLIDSFGLELPLE